MKTQRMLSLVAAALVLAAASTTASAACGAGNLVSNCGFETGDFTGWTLAGNDVPGELNNLYGVEGTDPFPLPDGTAPHGGDSQAFFADQFADPTTLSQAISTVAGTTYTVSFWMAQGLAGPGTVSDEMDASFGSGSFSSSDSGATGYTLIQFTGVASSASTMLSVSFGTDIGEYVVDDFSVTAPVSTVPEPSMLSLMGFGALMLGLARRRAAKRG